MTLRIRLVGALVVLAAVGLGVFGYSTYSLYSRTQYDRLDEQLRSARQPISIALLGGAGGGVGGGRPGGFVPVPSGAHVELRGPTGEVIDVKESETGSEPDLTNAAIDVPDVSASRDGRLFTTGSVDGDVEWRVSVGASPDGYLVLVALPTTDVVDALDRLLWIEIGAASILLVLLAGGSWFIVRRGLRPLEQMAASAGSITAGDLSMRVAPSDARSEVGQLGLALNTMLGELEDAFAERDETEQRLRQFLADASHELRTPLTSIQGFAELFRLGAADDPGDLAIVLRRIEQESARMRTLVDDLLLLARLDQTRPAERVPVDLTVLAADACSDARAVAPDRAVTLDAPGAAVVLGDPGHLRQAIGNLLANAIAHTPPATPINVAVRRDGETAVLTVRDHGPGLDDTAVAHVFDRFWQADAARVGAGAGLGLSIVQGIAREHGGIAAATNAPDGGAAFALEIPIGGAAAPDAPDAPETPLATVATVATPTEEDVP